MNENRAKRSRRNGPRFSRISRVQPDCAGHFEVSPEDWSVYEFPDEGSAQSPLGTQFFALWQSATHGFGYVLPWSQVTGA